MTSPTSFRLLPAPKKKHLQLLSLPHIHLPSLPHPQPVMWIFLLGLFFVNSVALANSQSLPWTQLLPVYTQPFNPAVHRTLGYAFSQEGLPDGATREAAIVADLVRTPVLGVTTQKNQKAAIAAHIHYWQSIVAMHPQYRDGYLALAQLLYQQGDTQEAYNAAQKAYMTDPTSDTARRMVDTLGKELGENN